MSAEELEKAIAESEAAVTKQGDTVRSLKAALKDGKADKADVEAAIEQLKQLKVELEQKQKAYAEQTGKAGQMSKETFRSLMVNTLERRMFYLPSFKIYGSVAGFYDFGPPGCAVKQNITQYWRQHFVLEENMLEVECPAVTPEAVLRASGHVERFTDFMVTDAKTGDCYRADHLLEGHLEGLLADTKAPLPAARRKEVEDLLARVGELGLQELGAALKQFDIKAPDTKNDVSPPFPFNLMFKTQIGPRGDQVGFLRPETAQGIFVNFSDLLYYNGGKLPFAAAQIGQSYRNEISPRAGLLRVREFTQAEIEHFCHPDNKDHPKFQMVAHLTPLLYSRDLQMGDDKKALPRALGDAVSAGVIANETLAYFIGRTYLFMKQIGIDEGRLRFRQHLQHEMAHYAADCWDAEVHCSYGWVECAGLADRSAFDLQAHTAASKKDLTAFEKFPETRVMDVTTLTPNKKVIGAAFKKDAKAVTDALAAVSEEDIRCWRDSLAGGKPVALTLDGGAQMDITPDMVDIKDEQKKLSGRKYTPSVIEPSFGIGRIIYCMFEHCYGIRDGDEKRTYFSFTPVVAPVKASVLPLLQKAELNDKANAISASLTRAGLSSITDITGTAIGKRYARTDEIGVPFAITVDHQTLDDDTVTLRDRDSMSQVRVPVAEVAGLLRRLADMGLSWGEVQSKYPAQEVSADKDEA